MDHSAETRAGNPASSLELARPARARERQQILARRQARGRQIEPVVGRAQVRAGLGCQDGPAFEHLAVVVVHDRRAQLNLGAGPVPAPVDAQQRLDLVGRGKGAR